MESKENIMRQKASNTNLNNASKAKNDEFYTQLTDIENEMAHYKNHFKNKVVYCNCDDPRISKFFHYFSYNFEYLDLKQLITTCYKSQNPDMFSQHDSEKSIYLEYDGDKNDNRVPDPEEIGIRHLESDGDFRNEECIDLLKQSDIVVTNPPFSLFREYVSQLVKYKKQFVIVGNFNAITYKEIFKLIKENKIWIGNKPMGTDMLFDVPKDFAQELIANKKEGSGYKIIDGVVKGRASAIWFTNLDYSQRHEDLILYKTYKGNEDDYPKYDNYDAIDISKIKNIPTDYAGVMGVPITFMDKYNPDQFEILGSNRGVDQDPNRIYGRGSLLNGKETFKRLFIKNKKL